MTLKKLSLFSVIFCFYSIAHPPSGATAQLIDKDTVEVAVYHDPSNPKTHYIKRVQVRRINGIPFNDGVVLFDQKFTSQTDDDSQDITIPVKQNGKRKKLKRGTKLAVTAECTVSGPWKKIITVR